MSAGPAPALRFRDAEERDVPAVAALLADDPIGAAREAPDLSTYLDAFRAMRAQPGNRLIVGEAEDGAVVATLQLSVTHGLSHRGASRATIEAVRVASTHRGAGLGRSLVDFAIAEARAAGCALVQLTSDMRREDARRFYEGCGFAPSHIGFKLTL